jgi:phytoene dehydrogenase-like protein
MCAKYDLVVVGAGNGGLSAACVASSLGLKTLLVEQHNLPGGFATSFVRGRFEFEPSLHALSGIGTKESPGALAALFQRAGVDVEWCPLPEPFRLIVSDDDEKMDVTVPFGVQEFINKVDEYLPGSGKSVADFFDIAKDVVDGMAYLASSKGNPDRAVLASQYGNLLRTSGVSVEEVEDFVQMPEEARSIVNALWFYLGVDISDLDFQTYGMILYKKLVSGSHAPKMRSHVLSMAFDRKIRENGGTILYNTVVTEINVIDGRVTGVTLSNGERIDTGHVISDVTQHIVYGKLISPETEIPTKQIRMANSRKKLYSGTVVYLGLNKSKEELGLSEYSYFVFPTGDSKALCADACSIETSRAQSTICLSNGVPGCSPPGTTILYILVLHFEESWSQVKPEEYFKVKNRIARDAVEYFERSVGVRILDSIEEIEVATPVTFARYTGSYRGEVNGYAPTVWDSALARALMKPEEEADSIRGLRTCGKGEMGGYLQTLLSGETAAHLAFKDIMEERQ